MTGRPNTERVLAVFLAPDAGDELPDRVIEAVLDDIAWTPQRRALRVPWRFPPMPALTRATAAVAVALLVTAGVGGAFYLAGEPGADPTPAPTSSPTTVPTPVPSIPSAWTTYDSAQYPLAIGYPEDWIVFHRATRAWTATDSPIDLHLDPYDTFTTPAGDVAVGVFSVPVEGTAPFMLSDQIAWAEAFCRATGGSPCGGIRGEVNPHCLQGHEGVCGVAVAYNEDVRAYIANAVPNAMTVVIVWRPEDDPTTARFGGSKELLFAFLEHLDIAAPASTSAAP